MKRLIHWLRNLTADIDAMEAYYEHKLYLKRIEVRAANAMAYKLLCAAKNAVRTIDARNGVLLTKGEAKHIRSLLAHAVEAADEEAVEK